MKYWKSMKDLAPPFTWKHPSVITFPRMSHHHVGIHSDRRLVKRPTEPDLRRTWTLEGAVWILFYIHRGPIKERNGKAAVRFQEVDASRTRKKGFEEREWAQWNFLLVFFLAVVSSLYIWVPQMTDKSRPWMPLGSLVRLQRTLWLVLYLCPQIQMFSFCFLPLDGPYPNFKAFGLFFSPKDFDLFPS